MRRLAVALAALAAVWGPPALAQTNTRDRDVSCLAVTAFAAATLDNPQEDTPLRIYFAYFLGRLNVHDPNGRWADQGLATLRTMTADQLTTTLLACAEIADRDFRNALQPTS